MTTSRSRFTLVLMVLALAHALVACSDDGADKDRTYAISGAMSGAVSEGVTMTLSGASSATTTTDGTGHYAFAGLANGSYTVTPSLAGFTFDPANRPVSLSGADAGGRDFVASAVPHAISGTVSGEVSQGVTVTLGGASSATTTTDGTGHYGFADLANGSYTVTPSLTNFTFTPANRTVTLSGADVGGQDFVAAAVRHAISGTVSGEGVNPGVTMTLTGASSATTTTDGAGHYAFDGLVNGNYTITPSLAGFGFDPGSRPVSLGGADVGGQDFATMAEHWSLTGSLAVPRAVFGGGVATLASGEVLVPGGQIAAFPEFMGTSTVELYDPATGTWSTVAPLAAQRGQSCLIRLRTGEVLMAGGVDYVETIATAAVYDPAGDDWTPVGSMSVAHNAMPCVLLDSGKVLIAGGINAAGPSAVAELYDPDTGLFTPTGAMTEPRYYHTGTVLASGKVLVAGGCIDPLGPNGGCVHSTAGAELYDPETGLWSGAGNMPFPVVAHTATRLASGKVLIAGGCRTISGVSTRCGDTASDKYASLYDPVAGSWSSTGSLQVGRNNHAALLLDSGEVLVAGGTYYSGGSKTTERYAPATGLWTPGPPMIEYHGSGAVSAQLPDGTWLVAGGTMPPFPPGTYTGASEIFGTPRGAFAGTWRATAADCNGSAAPPPLAVQLAPPNTRRWVSPDGYALTIVLTDGGTCTISVGCKLTYPDGGLIRAACAGGSFECAPNAAACASYIGGALPGSVCGGISTEAPSTFSHTAIPAAAGGEVTLTVPPGNYVCSLNGLPDPLSQVFVRE